MLEEDTDDIELKEIECGIEGKPAVIFGHHNKNEGIRILNHLHNKVGEGTINLSKNLKKRALMKRIGLKIKGWTRMIIWMKMWITKHNMKNGMKKLMMILIL